MPATAHFTPDALKFLKDLRKHNDRDWFASNKKRFESSVRDPFLRFIADFAPVLHGISACYVADPKPNGGSLFRIYRDVRFSKDKSPYKTHAAAHFGHVDSKKDQPAPGFYLHIEPGQSFLGGGLWHTDPATVKRVRTAIVSGPDEWQGVRKAVKVEGDRLSRPPKGFDPDHKFIEDLKLKDFVFSVRFTDEQICRPRFLIDVANGCRKGSPLMRFLNSAIGLDF